MPLAASVHTGPGGWGTNPPNTFENKRVNNKTYRAVFGAKRAFFAEKILSLFTENSLERRSGDPVQQILSDSGSRTSILSRGVASDKFTPDQLWQSCHINWHCGCEGLNLEHQKVRQTQRQIPTCVSLV